ncbi:MAG: Crp/Fnr family transcriptional regulator [Thermoguttaceae bacterium]|jgi:CRP-like cAMP-binding protein
MISPELVRRYNCFAPVPEESLKAVAMIAKEVFIPQGTRLFNEGDPAEFLSLIADGEVRIQYQWNNGEMRTIDTLVKGDLLGWSALVEPYKMTGAATTCTGVHLIQVAGAPLRRLCESDPLLGYRLMSQVAKLLADRLESARIQLVAV